MKMPSNKLKTSLLHLKGTLVSARVNCVTVTTEFKDWLGEKNHDQMTKTFAKSAGGTKILERGRRAARTQCPLGSECLLLCVFLDVSLQKLLVICHMKPIQILN